MSEKSSKKVLIRAQSVIDEVNVSPLDKEREYRKEIATTTQHMVDKLDSQKLRDIELEFMRKATCEELEDSIRKLNNHAICSGNVVCPKEQPEPCKNNGVCQTTEKMTTVDEEEKHGADCHCSKCCPNPNPSFYQKHRTEILIGVIMVCLLILSIGWLPTGVAYEALQKAYVELIVNLPKMSLLFIAGIAAFRLLRKGDNK